MLTSLRLALIVAAVSCASLLGGGVAQAAVSTTVASPFRTSAEGWTSTVDYNGLLCTPGFLRVCPSGTGRYEASGGTGGASDGYLDSAFELGLGVGANVSVTWTSPTFTAGTVDLATISAQVRARNPSGLISVDPGAASVRTRLIDVATPANSTVVSDTVFPDGNTFNATASAVPAGALVAGRTYRIELRTTIATGIASVARSGAISLDDVSLGMTQLEPPTGLTASASTTNGLKITGTVNPRNLPTSVSVQYGATTAYGATSSPVVVTGTGAQPYSVPLAGLTAGATYHYRVVAQNADGTATSSDGTFVVPLVPANTPPSVSGALNSVNRTATYDRVTGTTAVRLQVVNPDGTIASTTTDADLDGTAAFTLPAVDGTYGVRIIRDGAGGGSSTSSQVSVVLDTVAPATAGMHVTVAPTLSPDRVRTVTFVMPSDASSATAQVIDANGNPVGAAVAAAGGTATVTLGVAEGDYRVRVTVADAAGNTAAVVSDPVTLDQTAPNAGGAPVVSGAVSSRSRTVTFTRDGSTATATVQVLDDGGNEVGSISVPSGASANVTLPDADGAYQVRVRQTDLAGNVAVTAPTPTTLDRQPPAAGAAPTVTGANDQRVRSVSFTRASDAATATIEVLGTGGAVVASAAVPSGGAGSVTLPNTDADYDVRVRVADAAGNEAVTPATRVTLDRTPPGTYTDPPVVTGAVSAGTRTVTFTRHPAATTVRVDVTYGASPTVVDSHVVASGGTATIALTSGDGTYHVTVFQNPTGTSAARDITLDTTAPDAGPAPTVTGGDASRSRTVTFTRAVDAATVAIEILDGSGNVWNTVAVPSGASGPITLPDMDGAYGVRVRQTDAAGNAAVSASAAVTLDRIAPDAGGAPTVTGADNAPSRTVRFTRASDAVSAAIEVLAADGTTLVSSTPVASGGQGTITLTSDGDYFVRVRQTDAAGNAAVSPTTALTLDTVAPVAGAAPTVTGAGNVRARHVTFTRAGDVATATIEIVETGDTVTATGNAGDITLPDADGSYTVRVRVTDAAGNSAVTPTTTVGLDRVGPVPGPAPTVTGADNVRLRHVTFTRAGDAASARIQVLDAGGVVVATTDIPSGAAGDVTLPDADGTYGVRVRVIDADGNISRTPVTSVTLDRVAPAAGPAPDVTGTDDVRARHVTFTRAGDAAAATIEILSGSGVVDTVAVPSGGEADITLPNTDGTYGVRVRVADTAGNEAVTAVRAVTLDRTAPVAGSAPTVTGADTDRARHVSFTRAVGAVTVTVEILDSTATVVDTVAVPSGGDADITLPNVDDEYRIRVRQANNSGNDSVTPAATVRLDRAAPAAGGAPAVTGLDRARARHVTFTRAADATTAAIEIVSGGVVVDTVSVPSGNEADITLPDNDGSYDVRVRVADAAGNAATTPATTVTLDRAAPVAGPAPTVTGADNARARHIVFTRAGDAATATVEVTDAGGTVVVAETVVSGNTADVTLPDADGAYSVRVRQFDAAGNDAVTAGTSITLDRSAPAAGPAPTVTGADTTRARHVVFTRASDAATATIEIVGHGSTVATGNEGDITLPDADGTYTVRVRVTDAAGNDAVTAGSTITLDRAAPNAGPAPTVTGADTARARHVVFTRASDAATATIEVVGHGSTVATGNEGDITLPDADGTYTVRVRVADAAGNDAVTPGTVIVLDRAAPAAGPAPTVTGADTARARHIDFTRAGDAATATIEVLENGSVIDTVAVPSGNAGDITLPDADGTYTVRVRVADTAGNDAVTPATTITLDRGAPNPGAAPAVTGDDNTRNRHVEFTRAGDADTVVVEIVSGGSVVDSVPVASGNSADVTLPDADGTYAIRVRQTNTSGNGAVTPATTVTLDRSAPTAGPAPTVTGAGNVRSRHVVFTRAGDTATATIEVLNNGALVGTVVATGNAGDITLPDTDATYTVRVRQADAAGNHSTTPPATVTLDRSAPNAGPAPAITGADTARTRHVVFTRALDAMLVVIEILDNGAVVDTITVPAGNEADVTLPNADGAYAIRVRQTDAARNDATTPATTATLDRTAPAAGPAPTVTGATTARTRQVAFTRAGDTATAVIELVSGGAVVDTVTVPSGNTASITLPDTDGTYTVRVRQIDAAGNAATTPTTTVTLDRSAPNAGPAPTVTGAPAARSRHVVFTRAGDATTVAIELVDGNGTVIGSVDIPAGNEGDITLPDVDGTYAVRVRQTNANGVAGVTAGTSVTLTRATTGTGGGDDTPGGGNTGTGTGDTTTGTPTPPTGTPTTEPQASDPGGLGALLADCYGGTSGLVLTDVHAAGGKVAISGLSAYAPGTKITIVDSKQRTVATTAATATGTFAAGAAAPAKADAKRIRYTAVISTKVQSKALKLHRTATTSAFTVSGNVATLTGKVDLSSLKGKAPRLKFSARGGRGATACKAGGGKLKLVGKPKLNRKTGAFTVKVALPPASGKVAVRVRVTGSLKSATLYSLR